MTSHLADITLALDCGGHVTLFYLHDTSEGVFRLSPSVHIAPSIDYRPITLRNFKA